MSVCALAPLEGKTPSSPEISMVTSISEDRSTEDDRSTLSTLLEPPHEDDPNAWVPKLLTTNELLGASADLKTPGNSTALPRPTGRVVLEALDTGSSAPGPSSVSSHPLSSHPSALNGRQGGLAEGNVTTSRAPTQETFEGAPLSMSVSTLKGVTGADAASDANTVGGVIAGGQGQQGGSSGASCHGGAGQRTGREGDNAMGDKISPALKAGSNGGLLSSIHSVFQRGNGEGDLSRPGSQGVMSDGRSSRWNGLSSGRSYASGDDTAMDGFPEGHNRERAQRHWRVLRVVLMALGMFRVAGLNRLRAKQLSAAEVKRGLRRNVTGGGQNVIPTMSFYSPKAIGNADASTAKYETLCKEWARFSPAIVHRMLRQKFLEHDTVEQEFTCERFSTTLLFADISGFTRLSARLNAEQLKIHTNQYFTMLIDVVARYGGDIIKFCGDAVMIIWPSEYAAPRGVLQANAMQASACALAMLSECGKYDVGKGEEAVALRLHCGMGSGNMYGYLVGAEDRWEYLVAGDPLRQIGSAEPEAKQGEVILSPESWDLACTDFLATKTPQGNWLLKEPKDVYGSFPPPHLPDSRPTSPTRDSGVSLSGSAPGTLTPKRQRGSTGDSSLTPDATPKITRRHRAGSESPRPFTGLPGERVSRNNSGASGGDSPMGGEAGYKQLRKKGKKDVNGRWDKSPTDLSNDDDLAAPAARYSISHQKLTVTQNISPSPAISDKHRAQASEYLAKYIKAQYDGGVEKSMTNLSTALRGYTQESARHAIESDTVKYLAEIRFVTTIFVNIYGLEDQLKHGGGFLLQQTMDLGTGCLSKFGGVLRQFVVDDKGCVMIGAFGLPQYSYEDNEVRAISASKDIIDAFQGLDLAASIGITTGQVYCGFVGASKRCEYAMMGCSVNLSARLMASAPKNTIQVDFEVWSRACNFFNFETLTPIKAKGYVDPVPVFRPLGQALTDDDSEMGGEGDTSSDLMVGVTAELEALEAVAKRLQTSGFTRPVTIIGQAGSGKTRLARCAELQRIWRDTGAGPGGGRGGEDAGDGRGESSSIIAVCRNVHANTPYFVWNSILRKIFNIRSGPSTPKPDTPSSSAPKTFKVTSLLTKKGSPSKSQQAPSLLKVTARAPEDAPDDGAILAGGGGATAFAETSMSTSNDDNGNAGISSHSSRPHNQMRGGCHLPPIGSLAAPAAPREGGGDGAGDGSARASSLDRKTTLSREGSSEAAQLSDGDGRSVLSRQSALDRTNPDQEQPVLQKMGTGDSTASSRQGAESEGVLGRTVLPKQRRMSRIGRTSSEVPVSVTKEAGVGGGRRPSQYLGMSTNGTASQAGGDRRNLRDNIGKMSALAVAKVTSGLRGGEQDWASSRRSIAPRSGLVHRRGRNSISLERSTRGAMSRRDPVSRRTPMTRGGSGDAGLADEVVPEGHATQPNRTNTVLAAQVLKEKHAVKMEGLEAMNAEDVRGVGQAAQIIEWMRRECPDMVPVAPLLKELRFTGFSDSRAISALPPDVRHRNLERLVVEIVRRALSDEGKRLLLIIEDAQWMNPYSMKLLLKLARAQLKVMIVISARPFEEYFETVPNEFTLFREMSTTIAMSPLSPEDCHVLARHVVGETVFAAYPEADLLPAGSDAILHEKSGGGNPLFVRNIAVTLRDNLLMSGNVTPLVDLPAGFFHSLIVSRFDALEPTEQTVLKAGTVIGAVFDKSLLLHMLQNKSRDRTEILHTALLKLIEANFLSRSVVGQTERFSFVHTSVQETVYKMMLTDQKENLHEICAQWYEKHHKGNANYQSVIMHHWMRSGNTHKKVDCYLLAASKAQESFDSEAVIQHMLSLLAIAFGKDMATATIISLEPFVEATLDAVQERPETISPPPPPGQAGKLSAQHSATALHGKKTGGQPGKAAVRRGSTMGGAGMPPPREGGIFSWLTGGMGASGGRDRRRYSSMIVPTSSPLTGEEAEAEERLDAVRTALRLGCAVGNLNKRQRAMLVAKDQEWLWASDFLPCLEFSDPIFSPSMVARWIGGIGMAHLRMGRLLPAHNHMQEALAYLGFKPIPSQALPMQRALCIALERLRRTPRDFDDSLFAARLYCSIADISIKVGAGGNLVFINTLLKASVRGVDFMDNTSEGAHVMANIAQQEVSRGRHQKARAMLERALEISDEVDDPITRGIVLIASGKCHAGEGHAEEAQEDFDEAFEILAPVGDTSRCGEVMVESAYVKLCLGDTEDALFMFTEVRDVAVTHKDDFLSQSSLHGAALVHAIMGNMSEASASLAQLRSMVEEDWARRRRRRGRTAAVTEGTSHASLIVMETLDAYLAAARGDGKTALKGVCRASLRLSRSSALRFSSGLFLHLAAEACFTTIEQDMLPPGPEPRRRVFAAARLLVRTLARFAQVFDLISPLYHLNRARWSLLHGMDRAAEKALALGLDISEEDVNFPYAAGLLLLHSTRLRSLPMDERRARARRGRRTLHRMGACLIPAAEQKTAGTPNGGGGGDGGGGGGGGGDRGVGGGGGGGEGGGSGGGGGDDSKAVPAMGL